ncbi:hypothetical protein DL93DRAFT_1712085 [Clavulina sp. PMI_390]|nr:hypothetical protein DL93DRAFT_1712085 [Clavulina sp. PMI_390]
MIGLLTSPVEVLLHIIEKLHVKEIIILRMMVEVTQQRILWLRLLQIRCEIYSIPASTYNLSSMTSAQMERIMITPYLFLRKLLSEEPRCLRKRTAMIPSIPPEFLPDPDCFIHSPLPGGRYLPMTIQGGQDLLLYDMGDPYSATSPTALENFEKEDTEVLPFSPCLVARWETDERVDQTKSLALSPNEVFFATGNDESISFAKFVFSTEESHPEIKRHAPLEIYETVDFNLVNRNGQAYLATLIPPQVHLRKVEGGPLEIYASTNESVRTSSSRLQMSILNPCKDYPSSPNRYLRRYAGDRLNGYSCRSRDNFVLSPRGPFWITRTFARRHVNYIRSPSLYDTHRMYSSLTVTQPPSTWSGADWASLDDEARYH